MFDPSAEHKQHGLSSNAPRLNRAYRKIWLPKTLAYILREWEKSQQN